MQMLLKCLPMKLKTAFTPRLSSIPDTSAVQGHGTFLAFAAMGATDGVTLLLKLPQSALDCSSSLITVGELATKLLKLAYRHEHKSYSYIPPSEIQVNHKEKKTPWGQISTGRNQASALAPTWPHGLYRFVDEYTSYLTHALGVPRASVEQVFLKTLPRPQVDHTPERILPMENCSSCICASPLTLMASAGVPNSGDRKSVV